MKKQIYMAPESSVIELRTEGVIAMSAQFNGFNDEEDW